MQISKRYCNQVIFPTVIAIVRYSASVLHRDTIGCFLVVHETKFFPRKVQKLLVDLISEQQAQSPSAKAVKFKSD